MNPSETETRRLVLGRSTITLLIGDITHQAVDAIVNAANSSLMGGGGVDGAIHRAGGPAILEECKEIVRKQGKLPPGQAVLTTGGLLPARWVIHTVGPVWRGGGHNEAEILASCYRNSLRLATERGLRSVAFPAISTGAYGYPVHQAAQVALNAVAGFITEEERPPLDIRFVLFDKIMFRVYADVAQSLP